MKFTEAQLEQAIIELLAQEEIPHQAGIIIPRDPSDVLIKEPNGGVNLCMILTQIKF